MSNYKIGYARVSTIGQDEALQLVGRGRSLLPVGSGEDLVGGLGPDERVGAVVLAIDERADGLVELGNGSEGAAVDGLAFDDAEPDLDGVEPAA